MQGNILVCNPVAESLLGYCCSELEQFNFESLLHADGVNSDLDFKKLAAVQRSCEIAASHKNGSLIPVLLSVSEMTDPDNPKEKLFLSILKDIRSLKQAEANLAEEKKRFETIFNSINDAVFLAPLPSNGVHGNFVEVNDVACTRLGYSREEMLSMNARTINPAANLDRVKASGRRIRREGKTIFESIHVAKDGTQIPVEIVANVIEINEQEYVLSVVRDLREHKLLQQSESRFGRLIDHSWEEIYVFESTSLFFLQANQGALDNLGYSSKEIKQLNVIDIKPEISEQEFRRLTRPLFDGTESRIIFETTHERKNGTTYPVEVRLQLSHSEVPPVFLANVQDITERKKNESRLQFLANYDSLTGLPNRSLFLDRLKIALENTKRTQTIIAVIFLDLDGFKSVNDTLGHIAGDKLIKEVAGRLNTCTRKSDTVARLGGDEFTVILSNLKNVDGAEIVAQNIIKKISEPFIISGQKVNTSTSLGITLYPFNDFDDAYSLIKQADTAMYEAKKQGKNNYQFYTASLAQCELRRVNLENALKQAIKSEDFYLQYQPRVNLHNKHIIGVEALLRWTHPEFGTVSPAEFIPILESFRLIHEVGAWVLREACQQLHAWLKMGYDIHVSVNVSARQLESGEFPRQLKQVVDETNISPANLELEITEGALISQSEQAATALRAIKDLGVKISLDDFGSGYSSLNYLKQFAIDTLKIDRSFVMDIGKSNDSEVIVDAIISLGKSLNLNITAEGIETEEQYLFLNDRGCHEGQGYMFGKPMAVVQIEQMLLEQVEKLSQEKVVKIF